MSGHLRVALDTNADLSNLEQTAKRHGFVVLQPWNLEQKDAIKAARPTCKVICHKNLTGTKDDATNGMRSTGLPYTGYERFALGPTFWNNTLHAMDVGNRAYQQAWARQVGGELVANGWDGALFDNADIVPAFTFSSVAAWQSMMETALSYIGQEFKAAGLLAVPNIGAIGGYPEIGRRWLPYVDGAMHEQFVKWGTDASGYASPDRWRSDVDTLRYADKIGKFILAVTHGPTSDHDAALYGWGSALLANRVFYCYAPDYTHEIWIPEFDRKLGRPQAPAAFDATTGSRRFKRAFVSVNPTTHETVIA